VEQVIEMRRDVVGRQVAWDHEVASESALAVFAHLERAPAARVSLHEEDVAAVTSKRSGGGSGIARQG
jgi:hypothetical protein